jgi:excinuclease ABC subunit C
MTDALANKLKDLPKLPGVYFHKDAGGEIIYVGKAARLNNRVRQYFQKSRTRDPKTEALVAEIADTDWMVVDSEIEALFLEAEMVRRYMPRYNILLRDDKSMVYIRIDHDSDYPTVTTTRRPLDDGAKYFGPYLSMLSIRQALKVLRRIFPYATKRTPGQTRATLHYHIGLDPGLEDGRTSLEDYRANLRRLMAVIQGKKLAIERELEKDMKRKAKEQDFEAAAKARNQLFSLQRLSKQVIFGDKEFLDISKDHALSELVELLGFEAYPKRIEGYDISHMQGSDVVASMVVFTNGVSNKSQYRKFKTRKNQNDDFYNMNETIKRRFTLPPTLQASLQGRTSQSGKMWSGSGSKGSWKMNLPDLVIIDGGKGQLDAAIRARDEAARELAKSPSVKGATFLSVPFIGLAKREEQIVIKKSSVISHQSTDNSGSVGSGVGLDQKALHKLGGFVSESKDFLLVNIPHNTNLIKLLQRIRDESHRFAVSYHSTLKQKRQTASALDDIPGIGPATRKKLIRHFGSVGAVKSAQSAEIAGVVGKSKARSIVNWRKVA